MKAGFLSLIILLITMAIIAFLFMLTGPFSSTENEEIKNNEDFTIKDVNTPQRIQQTQDVVDVFQEKSVERQTIDVP